MTTTICIANATISSIEMHEGATLAEAAQKALASRGIDGTADSIIPAGGTHYHRIYRAIDPDGFWSAQLTYALTDDEEWGHGATAGEAIAMATPEADEV